MKAFGMLAVVAATTLVSISADACDRYPSYGRAYGANYGYAPNYSGYHYARTRYGYTWPRPVVLEPGIDEPPVFVRRAAPRFPVKTVRKPVKTELTLPPDDVPRVERINKPAGPVKPTDQAGPELPLPPNNDVPEQPTAQVKPAPVQNVQNPEPEVIAPRPLPEPTETDVPVVVQSVE